MKIYTDESNFGLLKVLAAAGIGETAVETIFVKGQAKIVSYLKENYLPILEIRKNEFIFSCNAIVSFLLARGGDYTSDQWIEWEATVLQPVLYPYLLGSICHNKVSKDIEASLSSTLMTLEVALRDKDFITDGCLTAADVVLWGALYPLFCDKGLFTGKCGDFVNVSKFVTALSTKETFQSVITTVFKGKGLSALKVSLLSQPRPFHSASATVTKQGGDNIVSCAAVNTEPDTGPETTIFGEKPSSIVDIEWSVDAWLNGKSRCGLPQSVIHPILPKQGERNILITSALPYVNNIPHLGNLIGSVLSADVFSRYCKLCNYNALFICGSDEYGTATETKAMEEGLTPEEICDKYHAIHKDIYAWFNVAFDTYGRTSTPKQTQISQDIFWKVYNAGYITKDTVDQLLCEHCNRYLADRFVEGTCPLCQYGDARGDQCDKCGKLINAVDLISPACKICHSSPVMKTSHHLFLDLPRLEPQLETLIERVFTDGHWTPNAKVITRSWLRDGLKPRCISRDLKWGTPVPLEGYTDKVFYVWFDAPIGYMSITANYTDQWERWWKNPKEVELYNFLGKDNVPFHGVIFPATLLAANDNFTLVNHIIATEYLNYEDGKFSKSRNVGVFGNQARTTGIPADVFRFYLLSIRPESQDSSFCWDDFLFKNNGDLLNNLGNFINRGLTFLSNNFGGVIQEITLDEVNKDLLVLINKELKQYVVGMEKARLRESLQNILSISRYGNQYLQHCKPWVLVKGSPKERSLAGSVVSLAANISCLVSVLLFPFMPRTSVTIQSQLNAPGDNLIITDEFVCHLSPGHTIGKVTPLFTKILPEQIADLKTRFSDSSQTSDKTQATTQSPKESQGVTKNRGQKAKNVKGKK